jgi:hypothetical protein
VALKQHEVIEMLLERAVELRNDEEGVTVEVLRSGEELARRSDQPELRHHWSERLSRWVDPTPGANALEKPPGGIELAAHRPVNSITSLLVPLPMTRPG